MTRSIIERLDDEFVQNPFAAAGPHGGRDRVRRLALRFPGMTLAVPAESLGWRPSTLIRGLETLPVRLSLRAPPRSNGRGRPDCAVSRAPQRRLPGLGRFT
jgi:hypothetical protein